jgi:hypothetical protein
LLVRSTGTDPALKATKSQSSPHHLARGRDLRHFQYRLVALDAVDRSSGQEELDCYALDALLLCAIAYCIAPEHDT